VHIVNDIDKILDLFFGLYIRFKQSYINFKRRKERKMKHQSSVQFVRILLLVLVSAVSYNAALADDLNPPPYRGGPLSVYAHWVSEDLGFLLLNEFFSVEDNDPSIFLMDFLPTVQLDPAAGIYSFRIPNFIDELPVKLLRLQLTWVGNTQPPIAVSTEGVDQGSLVPGVLTYLSQPLIFTQPDGGYQYFDFEYRPNPDFESIFVQLSPGAQIVQAVVDSISILPEPSSVGILAVGGFVLLIRKNPWLQK